MKYLIFNFKKCFDIVVEADSEKQALRKFISYVRENPEKFSWEGSKSPNIKLKIDGSYIYCVELRDSSKMYSSGIYLGEYKVDDYVLLS